MTFTREQMGGQEVGFGARAGLSPQQEGGGTVGELRDEGVFVLIWIDGRDRAEAEEIDATLGVDIVALEV